jgi:hypothetical protein
MHIHKRYIYPFRNEVLDTVIITTADEVIYIYIYIYICLYFCIKTVYPYLQSICICISIYLCIYVYTYICHFCNEVLDTVVITAAD